MKQQNIYSVNFCQNRLAKAKIFNIILNAESHHTHQQI